jgi:hypothetical protein
VNVFTTFGNSGTRSGRPNHVGTPAAHGSHSVGAAMQTLLNVYACMGSWSTMLVTFHSDTGSGLDVNCCVG